MYILPIISCIILVLIDQLSKFLVVQHLKPIETHELIKNVLSLTYVENTGMAFGAFSGARWFFVVLTIVILAFIGYYYQSLKESKYRKFIRICLLLITAGAIGNLIDRALNGFVVDFIQVTFVNFPVFNFADMCVVVGTISFAICQIITEKEVV